ncbi:MAG: DUF1109 domain-containing protein [Alphaproteobacteria bacterium]|nr:DUF1109 domain-containing protein [Alphaproteobacteria bacterium]
MDTDSLIQTMVEEGASRPLPHPVKQTILWLAGTGFYLGFMGGYFGLRPDIVLKIDNFLYGLEIFFLCCMSVSTAMAAFCLSRPDGHQKPWMKYLPFGFAALWTVTAFTGAMDQIPIAEIFSAMSIAMSRGAFDCPKHIALFSIPPGLAIFLIVRLGAPTQYLWAGSIATWSATSFGYLLLRLIEQNDNPAHLIVWHALPIVFMCALGMIIGKYALRWR